MNSDEALARSLQAQYEADHNRRRSTRNVRNPPPTVPVEQGSFEVSDAEFARRLAAEERSRNRQYRQSLPREQQMQEARRQQSAASSPSSFLAGSMSDEQYARHLAQQERQQQQMSQSTRSARAGSGGGGSRSHRSMGSQSARFAPTASAPPRNSFDDSFDPFANSDDEAGGDVHGSFDEETFARTYSHDSSKRSVRETPATSRSSSDSEGVPNSVFDEEMARRVEQELNDEELARRFQQKEERRRSEAAARSMATVTERKKCTCRRFLKCTIPMVIIAAVATGLIFYFDIDKDDFRGWIPSNEEFAEEDPFESVLPEDANRWRSKGAGLRLEVLNALDERWYPFFNTALQQWDNGTPDALTLFTSTRAPDPACEAIQGKLKVCNGNYGDTRWRGINQILLTNGFIVASSARLNEFYLSGAGADQAAYTTCHEIGHGFGLPHSDENFLNRDLGNCMDYTNNPSSNKQPDETNFSFLSNLYGVVPGSETVASEESVPGNRALKSADESLPSWLQLAYDEALAQIEDDENTTRGNWRLLHESSHGRAHEVDLGQGYTLQVHKLLVPDN